jgi:hypothetical protein
MVVAHSPRPPPWPRNNFVGTSTYATLCTGEIQRGPSGGEQSGATAVECGGDGGSALASRLSENEHIGMRNYKIQKENGSA